MTIEIAALIALCIALLCLIALVYVSLWWKGDDIELPPTPRDESRKIHYDRWEDRL